MPPGGVELRREKCKAPLTGRHGRIETVFERFVSFNGQIRSTGCLTLRFVTAGERFTAAPAERAAEGGERAQREAAGVERERERETGGREVESVRRVKRERGGGGGGGGGGGVEGAAQSSSIERRNHSVS